MATALPRTFVRASLGFLLGVPGWARVLALSFAAYGLATLGARTPWNAHTHLAWAILNGSYALPPPYGTSELIPDAMGRQFVAYGPTPAILLMPFVAVLGRDLVNQTLVSAFLGAIAVTLWWAFLGRMDVSPRSRTWLTVLFAAGTPFAYYAAQNGNNWAITHSVAVLGVMAAFFLARSGRPGWAGLCFGLAVLSRNPVILATPAVLFVALAPKAESWREAGREIRANWPALATFALGAAVAFALGGYYNWERFGSPLDNGYARVLERDPATDFGRKPIFSLAYVWNNLRFYLLEPPGRLPGFPWFGPQGHGMSMFMATPALLLLFFVNYRKPLHLVSLASILAIQAFYLAYYWNGAGQFGMRYTTDYLPLLMLLVAGLTATRFGPGAIALTLLGMVVEVWGFATWHFMGW